MLPMGGDAIDSARVTEPFVSLARPEAPHGQCPCMFIRKIQPNTRAAIPVAQTVSLRQSLQTNLFNL